MSLLNPWLILAALAVMGGTYLVGYGNGFGHCKSEYVLAENKGVKTHAKIEKKVMSLSDIELRKSYCQWVRDNRDKCLQANIPIEQ